MNKEFIPYEQALELKELGFNEPCLAIYNDSGLHLDSKRFTLPAKNSEINKFFKCS